MNKRTVAVLVHPDREEALDNAITFMADLHRMGFGFLVFDDDVERIAARVGPTVEFQALDNRMAELAVVFGGDGTILRAAEWALPLGVPLLGVNLGHVGFLAELEPSDLHELATVVEERRYQVEERLALEVRVTDRDGNLTWTSSAVNEVSLEKMARERMLNVLVSIDDRPLSRWGCDGVLVATPTGSTAYGFSAGGPVVWPDVKAMLVVPIAAHALFNRPMVLSPSSKVRLNITPDLPACGILWCDGRRSHEVADGETVEVTQLGVQLRLARFGEQPFTTRLVKKFALPVHGWRKQTEK
ncbi:NAD kinase [Tessaracoccus sp. ZS01]|uniref:NAD kinase n=1 Tax=Tessaracoccus sp. ZS01 TaxID=1906324 RepID=UPI00096DE01D|nr:NAD kinase [Tessaracoccus sp. ZS01]MCG6568363.1 NAD kinase [Tessaracoccus sp. ZS01]OMG53329.1 NAD kinase [Tessaracoccus sp. ZS01]